MADAWLRKKSMFEGQVKALDMKQLAELSADDPRGALLLTWSGSLVSVGPLETAGRRVEYASIELRTDVPGLAVTDSARLDGSLRVDAEAVFSGGPVRSTSAVLLIAACDPSVPAEEQAKRIREATIFLTNGFVKINRTVALPGGGFPELFTMRTIVGYLAEKNGVSRKLARQILEDYAAILESGLLLGHRVPSGRWAGSSCGCAPPARPGSGSTRQAARGSPFPPVRRRPCRVFPSAGSSRTARARRARPTSPRDAHRP
jgi:hypothetical protein